MKGPGLYSEIGKKARDLLTRDYNTDQKLTFSTCTASGVGLTSTAVKKGGGLYAADVATQYKYKSTVANVKLDAESNISSTVTISEILPSTKAIASLKFPDYTSGKLEVQYFHDHASFSSTVGLNHSPTVDVSTAVGAHGIVFGAEAGFDTTSKTFTKYNAGISLTQPTYIASLVLENKGDTLRASYLQHLDGNKVTAVKEFVRKFSTNENVITVGGSYVLDPLTSVKVRLNNSGKLGALFQHELKPKSVLTISTEVDTRALDQHPKFGLALALKP